MRPMLVEKFINLNIILGELLPFQYLVLPLVALVTVNVHLLLC